jgi:beta-glucosidase
MVDNQQVAANFEEAAARALNAGNDMIMVTPEFFNGAIAAVKSGKVNVSTIDNSVRRILEAKFRLGLFEDPRAPDEAKARARAGSPASRAQAQRAAEESLILLKNNGILPLASERYGKIAVLGPNADHAVAQSGDWSLGSGHNTMFPEHPREATITVLDGLKARFSGQIVYEKGAAIEANESANLTAALSAGNSSDLIIVVVGDRMPWIGERKSTANLNLVGAQLDLLYGIVNSRTPFILSVISSKPLVIPQSVIDAASAIVWQFEPGMLGGRAFARAVFGDVNPSGRLTISSPRHTGQVPLYYQQVRGSHQAGYADLPGTPQWAFGYGLSYSEVEYVSASLNKRLFAVGEYITVRVRLANWGDRDAVEVVQAYVCDLVTSAPWAVQELKGFARVAVRGRGTAEVTIIIHAADCSIVTADARRIVEPGDFELRIGRAANDILFTLPFAIG